MPWHDPEYEYGAPTWEIEEMDALVVDKMRCSQCGGEMEYKGYHKKGSYIALAVCTECGWECAF